MIDILMRKDPNQEIKPGAEFTIPMNIYLEKVLLNLGKKTF
jgi:hypothetical protein